jgi:L-threonylcarbamoyladenylate synthase
MSEIIDLHTDRPTGIIAKISGTIKAGGIVIMPSDTIYGIHAVSSQETRVREIKKRDDKPFIYLIDDLKRLPFFGIDGVKHHKLLEKYWPGTVTFIMHTSDGKTQGIRMPDKEYLRKIIEIVDMPILSTSVNFSGELALNTPREIKEHFSDKVELMVFDPAFDSDRSSTVVDITGDRYRVIREGSVVFNG